MPDSSAVVHHHPDTLGSSSGGVEQPPKALWVEVLQKVSRHWLAAILLPLMIIGGVVTYTLLKPRTYTAQAMFMPQSNEQLAGAAGLAAQLGLSLPRRSTTSPELYADLLRSSYLLRHVVETRYSDPAGDGSTADLVSIYEIRQPTRAQGAERAIMKLRSSMGVELDRQLGVVRFSVRAESPALAVAIAERLLTAISEFNQTTRRSQAAAERAFLEERAAVAGAELAQAEQELRRFLEVNRAYTNSAELMLAHDRIRRRVAMRQEIATTLAKQLEQARLDEVRDTPVVTVLEPPVMPARPDRRGLVRKTGLALMISVGLVLIWAFSVEEFRSARKQYPESFSELRALSSKPPWRRKGTI